MKTNKWRQIKIKSLRLRIVRENLRRLLLLVIENEIDRLDRLEDIYRQKRIENKDVPSHWKRERHLYDEKERIINAWSHSILRCSEGSMCKNSELCNFYQEIETLDKDMVWNPLLKHWICIDCYNSSYRTDSAKKELEDYLKQTNLL